MTLLRALQLSLSLYLFIHTTQSQGVQWVTGLAPGDVPIATRESWCVSQQKTCGELCTASSGQQATSNTCDYNQLSWLCVCSDGNSPDVAQFSDSAESLACNWQLNECLSNSTSSTTRNSCLYQYVCGGRNPLDVPGSTSTSTSASPTTSFTSATAVTSPTLAGSSTTGATQSSSSQNTTSYAWVAGLVIGLLVILACTIFGLWLFKKRRRMQAVVATKHSHSTTSSESLWDKPELDGSPTSITELHGIPKAFEVAGRETYPHSELEGSQHMPAELDGSSPLSQELSTISPRLIRSNAYRAPLSPTSPYSYDGEVSPAASTISEMLSPRLRPDLDGKHKM